MNYGTSCGVLKPLAEANMPDSRFEHEWLRSKEGERPLDIADLHLRLSECELAQAAPEKVRLQFETAKNLMLYSWFVFEFQTIAEMQAYASLELALRERFNHPTREVQTRKGPRIKPLMLFELLAKAVDERVIEPEKLPAWEWTQQVREYLAETLAEPLQPYSANDWMDHMRKTIPQSRNSLAHGNFRLHLPNSFYQLELCGDLINQLFLEQAESAAPIPT